MRTPDRPMVRMGVDGTDGGDGDVPRTDNDHDGYFSDVVCNDND